MVAGPPPKLVAALHRLRRLLSPLDTCTPDKMASLLVAQAASIDALCHDIAPLSSLSQPALATTLCYIATEGSVPTLVPKLLRRLHALSGDANSRSSTITSSGSSSSSATTTTSGSSWPCGAVPSTFATPTPSPPGVAGVSSSLIAGCVLVSIIAPLVSAALHEVMSPGAVAAGAAFMTALVDGRPCSGLAATLALARAALPLSTAGGDARHAAQELYALVHGGVGVARLSLQLLCHAWLHEPAGAALREDMAACHLLYEACHTTAYLLGKHDNPGGGTVVPVLVIEVAQLAMAFTTCCAADHALAPADWVRSARRATWKAATAEPAYARTTLQALRHFWPPPQPLTVKASACTPNNQLILLQAVSLWLDRRPCDKPSTRACRMSDLGLTGEEVGHLAAAGGVCSGEITARLLLNMTNMLSAGEQMHAFPGIAAHAGQLLDRLAEWYRSGGVSDVFSRGGLGAFANMDFEKCSRHTIELVAAPLQVVVPWRKLYAHSVTQLGLIGKMEALLRVKAVQPWPQQQAPPPPDPDDSDRHTHLSHTACKAAAAVMATLQGEAREGPHAFSAYLSLLATSRKAVARQTQEAAGGGGGSGSSSRACGGGNCQLFEGMPQKYLQCAVLQPLLPIVTNMPSIMAVPAARAALCTGVLQLLPGLVQGLTAGWLPPAPALHTRSEKDMKGLLRGLVCVRQLHCAGLCDMSLAAGVPGLLLGLLCCQHVRIDLAIASAVLQTAASAGDSDAWLRDAVGQGLVEELAWWGQAGPALVANARGRPLMTQALEELMAAAGHLKRSCKALPPADPAYVGPTWDSCALTSVARAASAGCALFLGCWHRGCTNLQGDTEASLKLLLCSGCRMARYCCIACQKQAWVGGHRAACSAWKAQQQASPAASSN